MRITSVSGFVLQQLLQRNTKSFEAGSHSSILICQILPSLYHIKESAIMHLIFLLNMREGNAKLDYPPATPCKLLSNSSEFSAPSRRTHVDYSCILRCICKPRVEPTLARIIPLHSMVVVAILCRFCYNSCNVLHCMNW